MTESNALAAHAWNAWWSSVSTGANDKHMQTAFIAGFEAATRATESAAEPNERNTACLSSVDAAGELSANATAAESAAEPVQVTDADREAADKAFDIAFRGDTDGIDDAMASLFSNRAAQALAEVVTWLRETDWGDDDDDLYGALADAIERGEHRSKP